MDKLRIASSFLLTAVAACDATDPSSPGLNGYPSDEDVPFCETEPRRSNSVVMFSTPLPRDDNVEYEISISADFETFDGEYEYPVPLVCTLTRTAGDQVKSCPEYQPGTRTFAWDYIPDWEYRQEDGKWTGFRWSRIVTSADIRLTRNGETIFEGPVAFEVETSQCPEHIFDDYPDHPEYGQAYRRAEGTADTSSVSTMQ